MKRFLPLLLCLSLLWTACQNRHDRESEAMQNMVDAYPRPSVAHFQYGYETVLRAVFNAMPDEMRPEVFEGVRKLAHFNDSPGSGLWFNEASGVRSTFYNDLKEEGFEVLMTLQRDGQAVEGYILGDEIVYGAVVILETAETVQIFDLAGDINLKELSKLLQTGDLGTLDLIDFSNFKDLDF